MHQVSGKLNDKFFLRFARKLKICDLRKSVFILLQLLKMSSIIRLNFVGLNYLPQIFSASIGADSMGAVGAFAPTVINQYA